MFFDIDTLRQFQRILFIAVSSKDECALRNETCATYIVDARSEPPLLGRYIINRAIDISVYVPCIYVSHAWSNGSTTKPCKDAQTGCTVSAFFPFSALRSLPVFMASGTTHSMPSIETTFCENSLRITGLIPEQGQRL